MLGIATTPISHCPHHIVHGPLNCHRLPTLDTSLPKIPHQSINQSIKRIQNKKPNLHAATSKYARSQPQKGSVQAPWNPFLRSQFLTLGKAQNNRIVSKPCIGDAQSCSECWLRKEKAVAQKEKLMIEGLRNFLTPVRLFASFLVQISVGCGLHPSEDWHGRGDRPDSFS